ncbi:MAG: carbohydrate binding domain-containing protein [Bryobacteraceae bacterium]
MPTQDDPTPRRFFGLPVRTDLLAVTLLGAVALAIYAVFLGKDANYDFRNYHYYGCYCLLHGRLGLDIFAAQIGQFLNPVAYLPFCWAVDHLPPVLVGILFGALAGLSLGLLYQLTWTALAGLGPRNRIALSFLTAVAGLWSPLFLSAVGTSFTDSWTPLLVMLGLLAVLRDAESPSWRLVLAAGVALGLAMGFKLVNGVFALALLLTLCTTFSRSGFLRRIVSYCTGVAAAAMLVGGSWAFALAREFGNPFFPFFNGIFKSPYLASTNFSDGRWKATTLGQALDFPLHWAAKTSSLSSEFPFRDLRFAVFVVLLLPVLVLALSRLRPAARNAEGTAASLLNPAHRRLLLWFFTLAYLLWLYTFGHMRYATALELLCPLAILALCDCLIANRGAKQRAFVALALLGIAWVRIPDWGRRPYGDSWFETTIPSELRTANTLYVMPDSALSAYLVPMLPADSRFVRIVPSARPVPPDRWLGPRIASIISHHTGPLRILAGGWYDKAHLAAYGVSVRNDDCVALHTYADSFAVCSAYRTAAGASTAVALARSGAVIQLDSLLAYKNELLLNADFREGLLNWDTGGPVDVLSSEHAVRVTEQNHAHQLVKVTPGTSYKASIRARCTEPGTQTRLQINWLDASGKALPPSGEVITCTPDWTDYSAVFQAPPAAAAGLFYLTSHTQKPVLIQHASFTW